MPRSIARSAVALLFVVYAAQVRAEVVSTHCTEREIALDHHYSVARLERCGDRSADALLWHLDRIEQINANLDGWVDRGNGGA